MVRTEDYDKFVDTWARAWELYGRRLSSDALDLAFSALERFDLPAITRALTAHVNDPDTGQFPPKPADIVRLIEGRKEDRAQVAWTKVEHAARRVGQYETVGFDDPIIHAVIRDMGGWIDLCMTEEDELPFKARQFMKQYQAHLIRGGVEAYPKALPGRTDQVNHVTGFRGEEYESAPVFVGDVERAKLVYQGGGEQGGVRITRLKDRPEFQRLVHNSAGTASECNEDQGITRPLEVGCKGKPDRRIPDQLKPLAELYAEPAR